MPELQDTHIFNGKMNQDVDPRFIAEGDYYDALNITTSNKKDGRSVAVTNRISNDDVSDLSYIWISYPDWNIGATYDPQDKVEYGGYVWTWDYLTTAGTPAPGSGGGTDHWINATLEADTTARCIGLFSDSSNDLLYYFVTFALEQDRIVSYNPYTDTWATVIQDDALNFDEDYPILSFTSSGNYIFFTDNNNPPRVIDLTYDYTAPTTLDETYLSVAKIAPIREPSIDVVSDTSETSDNITGRFLQFKYRYVFHGDLRSAFSAISKVAYSPDDYLSAKELAGLAIKYNAIIVTMNGDNANDMITHIEIAAREGNLNDFKLIDKIAVSSTFLNGGDQSITFYNNSVYKTLEINESNQLFSDVPLLSKSLLFANNRLFMANNLSGYNKFTPTAPLTYQTFLTINDMADISASLSDARTGRTILSDATGVTLTSYFNIYFGGYVLKEGDRFTISGYSPSSIYRAFGSVAFTSEAGWTTVDWINKALSYMIKIGEARTSSNLLGDVQDPDVEDSYGNYVMDGLHWYNEGFTVTVEERTHDKTFKSGAWYDVGMQYYDGEGRTNGVQLNEEFSKIYIPTLPERNLVAGDLTGAGSVEVWMYITSTPPLWAKYWKIVYARASTYSTFIQTTALESRTPSTGKTRLNINSISQWNDESGAKNVYIYEPGDKVRILTYYQAGTIVQYDWAERLYEAEIIDSATTDYDGLGTPDLLQWIEFFDVGLTNVELTGSIIEIVRPSLNLESEDILFTESNITGTTYQHPSYGWIHEWNGNYQTLGVLKVTGITGDAWIKTRVDYPIEGGGDLSLLFEGYSLSDFRDSVVFDMGRATAIITKEQSQDEATIAYTERLIPNTSINNTNIVYPDVNFEEYDKNFGAINLMVNGGDHILVFQEDQVSKVMLDRAVMYGSQGDANYLGSVESVLSTSIPIVDFGIHDPFSFVEFGDYKYWVDIKRGAVIQLGRNGVNKISDIGMSYWFTSICENTISAMNKRVVGAYNPQDKEYIISFIEEGESIVYGETDQGWKTRLSYEMIFAAHLNNYMYFAYKNQSLSTYLYKFGYSTSNTYNQVGNNTLESPYIVFISNKNPNALKNYLAIELDSTYPADVDIYTESINGLTDQHSTLDIDYDFTKREQVWQAAFFRDLNTPNVTYPLISGDTIKGKSAKIKLTLGSNVTKINIVRLVNLRLSNG